MALLKHPASAALLAALLPIGCSSEPNASLQLALFDAAVECPASPGEVCSSADGQRRALRAEPLAGTAFISRRVSQYGDQGYYLYFEVTRQNGVTAMLELDVPAVPLAAGGPAPRLEYREYQGGALVFESGSATGLVQIPPSGDCPCHDGRLELRFAAAGADGVLGTSDDEQRQLSQGHFVAEGTACWSPRPLPIMSPLQVVPLCTPATPVGTTGGGSSSGGTYDPEVYVDGGCGGEVPEPEYEETGCDTDTVESSDEGCDADSSGSSGCEGDTGEGCDSGSGGGCEGGGDFAEGCGDAGGAAAACELDAQAARPHAKGRRSQRALGMLIPWAAFGLVHCWLRRRRKPR